MITFLLCRFIWLPLFSHRLFVCARSNRVSFSLSLIFYSPAVDPFLLSFSSSPIPFSLPSSILSLSLSLPLSACHSVTRSLWPETDNAVRKKKKKRQQSRWSANLLSFLQCIVVRVCVRPCWTRDSGVIRFPVTARDPKTMSEVWSIAGQVPAAGRRDDGWDLDIVASSDDKAGGQGWEAYCQMYSITDDSLLITE